MRKSIKIIAASLLISLAGQSIAFADYEWAMEAVNYCVDNEILSGDENGDLALGDNLTREQMSRILVDAFDRMKEEIDEDEPTFSDVDSDRWSYGYIESFAPYMKKKARRFKPEENVTREEFASSLVLASGLKEGNIRNPDILEVNFKDYTEVDADYKKLMCIAVERGYFKGSEQLLRPQDLLTRAEACTLLYRVLGSTEGKVTLDLGVIPSETCLVGEAQITVEEAKAWAKKMGAHQRFIDIADIYWEYGEITGIRPEILYAQAAKETGYGKYGGAVVPEQNNWAGIKTKTASGDRMEDHETFETPEDGVRRHFNHMSAYIGLEPVGEPHGRYYSVKSIKWAGTVETLEELGGKWCPDLYYGYSILHRYIEKM
jgi:hypothetical protein